MTTEKNEKIIEEKVNLINLWDKNNIVDLKEMIEDLDIFLEQIDSDRKIEDYVDFSDLPSWKFDFDEQLWDQPIWAIDINGLALVGERAEYIEHVPKELKYNFDHASGAVYKYSRENKCYIFCGNLMNRSESRFIKDFEDQQSVDTYNLGPWGAPPYGAPDCEDTED